MFSQSRSAPAFTRALMPAALLLSSFSVSALMASSASASEPAEPSPPATGQLRIPLSQQGQIQGQAQLKLPARGMSMSAVEQQFGTPERREGPIGNPPITRWFYPEYKVVFEHQTVIGSVRTFVPASAAPAPAVEAGAEPVEDGKK